MTLASEVATLHDERLQDALRRAGITIADTRVATAVPAAVAAAEELGYPVVLKAGGLVHKSDAGGVVAGLIGVRDVEAAATSMIGRIPGCLPFLIQRQYAGHELLLGIRRDPALGAAVVVGAGGTLAELERDFAIAMAPVAAGQARGLLSRLRRYPVLQGYRGSASADLEALTDAIVGLSDLALADGAIAELDINPLMVGPAGQGCVAVDGRLLTGLASAPPDPPVCYDLRPLFEPAHIVIVGASDDESKAGARIFAALRRHGYAGTIDLVHPAGGRLHGKVRHTSLNEVPGKPDLVSIAVPAPSVPEVVRDATARKVGAIVVHSSGFAEQSAAGSVAQHSLAAVTRDGRVPLAGPNCMGIVSTSTGAAVSMSDALGQDSRRAGRIALVTSSGGLGSCIASRLADRGVGLSRWVHLGNEACLDAAAYLDYLAADGQTAAVGLLLEHIGDGSRFIEAGARLRSAGKPLFVYAMARTTSGMSAASTHIGAMVGDFTLRAAVIEAAGGVTISRLDDFVDTLTLASSARLPRGRRLVAITASGGACIVVADQAEGCGLLLPALPETVARDLRGLVPDLATLRNPIDLSAQVVADAEKFGRVLTAVATSGSYDAVLMQFTTNADPGAAVAARSVLAASAAIDVPVYLSRFGAASLAPAGLAAYKAADVALTETPDGAMRAIAALARASELTEAEVIPA